MRLCFHYFSTQFGARPQGKLNQRTSGPVNTHLIPGIYLNTFKHDMYIAPVTNCDYSLGGVMGSVLMCIFNVD